ncbi:MAG: DUF4102 domain-containing protein [Deltaproteobacteria bacterium]|nr:DUF4102 domain-containing protein [Deltaproteobacteria bacterium]
MLTASEVQKINREKRPRKMAKVYDERGLYLEVPSSGSLRWRLKYRYDVTRPRLHSAAGVDGIVAT